MNLKKKMVKIPIPLSVEEDISEEEFVGVMKKLCERVARLEMNEMKNYNRINEFRQFVNKLPGASPAMKDAHNFDKLVDAQEKCPNKNFVSGPEEYVKLTRHVSFEEVATKEQVEERDRREEERSKELVEGLRNPELEEMRAKGKAAEERLLKSVEDSLKECEIYKPTVEDVRTSIVTRWVGPNMAVRQSIDPVKPFVNTEGIGSKPCVEGGNILEDYDSKSFKNKRQPKFDIERKTSVLSDMLQGELRIPFADPAIDPVQDSIKDVYVKRDKRGKQLDWVQYYRYMSDVLCNFNRVCVEVDVERQNELKIGGTKDVECITNVAGIVSYEYLSEDEILPEEFYEYVSEQLEHIEQGKGLVFNSVNLSFIDQNSRMHYYSVNNLAKLRNLIVDHDLDGAFGGSDDVPEDFMIVLSTRRFRINAIDNSGGNNYHVSDYYECIDVGGGEDNCLIECFKYLTGSMESCDEVRRKLKFASRGLLGNKHMKQLEEYFELEICVKVDEFNSYFDGGIHYFEPRVIYGELDCPSWLLYKNNHYSVILDEKVEEILKLCKTKRKLAPTDPHRSEAYYFFDYETVWDPITYKLQPYSFAMIKCDEDGNIIEQKFEIMKEYEIIEYMRLEHIRERYCAKYLIGYNNSRFDNFILLKNMADKYAKDVRKAFFANNTILTMKMYDFNVMDLCRILNMPLARACKAFKCEQQKLSLDHSVVQSMFMKGELESYIKNNYDKIKEYNLMDVKSLAELYFKTKNEIDRLCDVNIQAHKTLAGMSYRIFQKLNKDENIPIHGDSERNAIRQAVVGGRAQIFQVGEFNSEPLCCIDCVSLYPYVMLNNVFPLGDSQFTEEYEQNKIGVYKIKIMTQPQIKIMPQRDEKTAKLDWNKQQISTCATSQDIDTLKKHGCEVKVKYGFYWDEDIDRLFQSYFEPLVEEKKKQDELKDQGSDEYNPAVRELCKLLMNSLSGKLIQRDYDDIVEIVKNKHQLNSFRQKCEAPIEIIRINKYLTIVAGTLQQYINKMPTIYGALIYSYARSHMYDTILSKVDSTNLFGMDTDSAFITQTQYHELLNKYPEIFGNDFGQFKEEILDLVNEDEDGPFGIFVAPKCYCFYARNKTTAEERFIKARFKGVNTDRDRIWDTSLNFNKLTAREIHELYFGAILPKVGVDFYRKCLKENVTILHSNLTKTLINKTEYLDIKQHFCLKVIKRTSA
ncbi:hypothetical protein EDC05_006455 [Coemansia umbellata]|uniref:Probable DNA polymerase n=1 Tax=Coemansia umbellata TaxID=1424467 RepID=A0ABQ8PCQ6_9FUNG|nr:hypothetical protein EDC05_006455 [Coemansia umbellata]